MDRLQISKDEDGVLTTYFYDYKNQLTGLDYNNDNDPDNLFEYGTPVKVIIQKNKK